MLIQFLNARLSSILCLSFLLSKATFAQLDPSKLTWEKYKTQDGVVMYRATEEHKSGLIPLKAHTILDHPMPKVLTVISDSESKHEWVPYLVEAHTLEKTNTFERIEYARYDSPWPFDDRVFVIKISSRYRHKTQEVIIKLWSVEHPKAPLHPERVRGMTYAGRVLLRPEENGAKTFMEVMFLTDFMGNIPTWIVNMVQLKWPWKMFRSLNRRLDDPNVKVLPEFVPANLHKDPKFQIND